MAAAAGSGEPRTERMHATPRAPASIAFEALLASIPPSA
jgi:hypothetical protein